MKKIAFAGSNSSKSINHQLLQYVTGQVEDLKLIRLTDFEIPLYSADLEEEGFPKEIIELTELIRAYDLFYISVAEHNGNLTAFFKSILDWLSRYDRHFLLDKKVILLSTSPGKMGAASALESARQMLTRFKAEIIATQSFGNFNSWFIDGTVSDSEIAQEIENVLKTV